MRLSESEQKAQLTRWATYASVAVAVFLLLLKLWGWWMTGSVGLLATLLDSAVDIVASVTILLAVRLAQQPPDNEHRFGHGKAEPLAAFAQSIFIAGSALYLIVYAVDRLLEPEPVRAPELGVWVMAGAMLLTFLLVAFQRYVVRVTGSTAVMADSWHYMTDLGANAAVLVGLLLAAYGWIDATLGLLIGALVGYQAVRLALNSANQLLDRELPEADRDAIRDIILSNPSVEGFNDLRTYRSGPKVMIQFDLELEDMMCLHKAHAIAEEVTDALHARFGDADISVHQEPLSFRHQPGHHQWEIESKSCCRQACGDCCHPSDRQ
ncbi:cation diffusion facilitator family transporter [Thiomicrospira sp. WB1]|uniref:cation diffusion facilitator family transporter n=1 Tax=Thiomicrospira sp. WB1 TaxID=1685380 RepID=UPI000747E25A|nr:cation diffusion facilitator family transporter [Thiomicrospira sp. WB1]KUJ71169.1 cation-efflux pump FieF [Thiomicrospira sp. WB1]